jgi:EAL domain-containing protein (putative c-di-GMP-specific phosphodiesterase class I)
MPIDMLKIAQTFVRNITSDPKDAALATAIVMIGHSMEIDVIAEGVETMEQLNILKNIHCDKIQGFLVSRPLPPEEVEAFLKKGKHFVVEPRGLPTHVKPVQAENPEFRERLLPLR